MITVRFGISHVIRANPECPWTPQTVPRCRDDEGPRLPWLPTRGVLYRASDL